MYFLKCIEFLGLGFGSNFFKAPTIKSLISIFFVFINVSILVIELHFSYIYRHIIYHQTSLSGSLADLIQVVGSIIVPVFMILECIVKHKTETKFLLLQNAVDKELKYFKYNKKCAKYQNKNFIRKICFPFLICSVIDIFVVSTIETQFVWRTSILVRLWASTVQRIGTSYIIHHMEWLNSRLKAIELNFRALYKDDGSSNGAGFKTTIYRDKHFAKFLKLKEIYVELWNYSQLVNKRFDWSIVSTVILNFMVTIICFYWVFLRLYFNQLEYIIRKYLNGKMRYLLNIIRIYFSFVESFIFSFPNLIVLYVLISSFEGCIRSVRHSQTNKIYEKLH